MKSTFKHPCNIMIAGPTQSGKTENIKRILLNIDKLFTPNISKVYICYKRWQNSYEEIVKSSHLPIEFIEGIIDTNIIDSSKNSLVILDDLITQSVNDDNIFNLFTIDSHHKNISVIIVTQNLFSKGKHARSISLNCHYIFVMNNPRDRLQISYLAREMFPTNQKFLVECYEDATSEQYGYLFLDFKQDTPKNCRVSTKIYPEEERICYIPK